MYLTFYTEYLKSKSQQMSFLSGASCANMIVFDHSVLKNGASHLFLTMHHCRTHLHGNKICAPRKSRKAQFDWCRPGSSFFEGQLFSISLNHVLYVSIIFSHFSLFNVYIRSEAFANTQSNKVQSKVRMISFSFNTRFQSSFFCRLKGGVGV